MSNKNSTVCVRTGFTAHVSSIQFILYKRERANVITANPACNCVLLCFVFLQLGGHADR